MKIGRIILLLLAVLVLGPLALAEQQAPPYPTAFWITGKLTTSVPGLDLSGFKVVFYNSTYIPKEYSDGYALSLSDASANFSVNAHDDLTMLPLTNRTFYIGVVKKAVGGKFYGVNEAAIALEQADLDNGYKVVTLDVKEGEGIPDPGGNWLADTGWIRNTNITRNGENLILTWDYDPNKGPTAVEIYALSGAGAVYVYDTQQFLSVGKKEAGITTTIFNGLAYEGNNYYYRVVPDPLPLDTTVLSDTNNSITVGKVEIAAPKNKYVFAALPFQSDNTSLAGILGEQLGSGGEFLWWNGAAYGGATYSNNWSTDHALRIGEGFIVRALEKDEPVALLGRFGPLVDPCVRQINGGQYNLIAFSYPTTKYFADMGLVAEDGADLLKWNVDQQAYEGATYSGDWNVAINNFELAAPRYYRPKSSSTWTIQFIPIRR